MRLARVLCFFALIFAAFGVAHTPLVADHAPAVAELVAHDAQAAPQPTAAVPVAQVVLAKRLASQGVLYLWPVGDSMTGGNTYGYGNNLQWIARQSRGDLRFVGSQVRAPTAPYPAISWSDDGHSGLTTSQITSGYSGWLSTLVSLGQHPDIIVLNSGTNDLATKDPSSDFTTLLQTVFSTARANSQPVPYVLIWKTKPSPTASPNDVNRAAFSANLPGIVAGVCPANCVVVDPGLDAVTDGEAGDSPAFTHPGLSGRAKIARAIWHGLQQNFLPPPADRSWVGAPTGSVASPYLATVANGCLSLPTTSTNIYKNSYAALEPGTTSFLIGGQVYFSTLQSLSAVYSYGISGNAYSLVLAQASNGAIVYLSGASPVTWQGGATTVAAVWQQRVWHSWVLHGDAANSILSLWIDGRLVAFKTGATWGSMPTGDYSVLGSNSSVLSGVGMLGYARTWIVAHGGSVPSFYAFGPYVEAWHFEQARPVLPGTSLSAAYLLSDNPATSWFSDVGGSTISTYGGTPAYSAPGAVPTLWDFPTGQASYPRGSWAGSVTCNGTSAVTFTGAFPAGATLSYAVTTAGGTPCTAAPLLKVTSANNGTVVCGTTSCNDALTVSATWQ